jgi:endonuclease III
VFDLNTPFHRIIIELAKHYRSVEPLPFTDPLHLILWENLGYLIADDRREAAFVALQQEVGLKPADILSASSEKLIAIAKLGGIHPELRAQRLKEIAHIVLNDFDGDLTSALALPLPKAIKALKKFPSIGEPGAEKILLFSKTYPLLALDSNGLRVLLRLGFGKESKNYATSYASVRTALKDQIGEDCDFLIRAHQLLRQHGKELCRRSRPHCGACPLRSTCKYFVSAGG